MRKISLLIPCYNEEASLQALYSRLRTLFDAMPAYEWEVLLVNDGSTDGTLDVIKALRATDSRVCFVDLSRNFGKERALLAGFDHATGHCAVVLDADLQHPPEVIRQMVDLWEQGYDDVYARRLSRNTDPWLRRVCSRAFYSILRRMAKIDVVADVGDFRLLDRRCIDALRQLRECERYTKGMYSWIGFRKKEITFEAAERSAGVSKFGGRRLFTLALDGITSFSIAPLRLSTLMGFIVSAGTFIYMLYCLIKALIVGDPVQGFPTLIVVMLFLGGVQLLSLGIIGEYVGRIYSEAKHRPPYLVREKGGID